MTAIERWRVVVGLALAFYAAHLSNMHPDEDGIDGIIIHTPTDYDDPLDGGKCSIDVQVDLSCDDFVNTYLGVQPVIIRPSSSTSGLWNAAFSASSSRDHMETEYGELRVKMSTANSYTGKEWTEMTVSSYMATQLHDTEVGTMGNETFYLFGSTRGPAWDAFLATYNPPTLVFPSESFHPPASCDVNTLARHTSTSTSVSFGMAGRGSGVPFHFHGPGFLQQIHGRKRWFLYPPRTTPEFHPDESTLQWVKNVYPTMRAPPTHECVLEPRDVLYFPNEWMHATLNLSPFTVFVATFA
ncbi:hypothetical protein DYB37_004607 [Aphanomyces astaci]|uniref:JmjC domain-containing protein n=1 Tax=Aphanomyces astaci TaxID=112090 RepID=A0A3R6Z8U2_APHAT|nr:hypothetical protein DYB35_000904 [Aphanomyces astaci]RHZ14931.1 hypothetical protein DYB37_004607 [Aphanomyces astaci]